MEEHVLNLGKEFLVSYLKDKNIEYENIHPWRNKWEFVVLHCLRVEGYVVKLLSRENHNLSEEEIVLIRLAAILHDVGRVHTREGHALLGRNIVEQWLKKNSYVSQVIGDTKKLLKLIESHSNKEQDEEDYCLKVLKDADILDEIGAMSIFMASNWINKGDPYFFQLLYNRLDIFEMNFCEECFKLLNTDAGKEILEEKKNFIAQFNSGLKEELYGTEVFGEVKIEDYFSSFSNL